MTVSDSHMQLVDAVEAAKNGADLMVRCPGHEDQTPSLHVSPSPTGVLLKCMASCDTAGVLASVNLTWADLFLEESSEVTEETWTPAGPASHIYRYCDETGVLRFEVLRVPQGASKTFRQRRPSGDPVRPYVWSLEGVERVLYRLPQITAAVRNGQRVHVAEGERDVDTLVHLGLEATCNSGGAGKWLPQYTETLAGAEVVVIADADNVGRAHARMVRDQLTEAGCKVAITEAPSPYKDVTELLSRGGKLEDLLWVVPFEETERVKFGVDVLDIITRSVTATEFVVPGTLARKERLLITGIEGHGKSTLLRQMSVMSACGLHWWTGAECEPQKVLYIDGENEPNQTLEDWQNLIGLAAYHTDKGVERGMLTVLEEWDSEIDLSGPSGTAWLHERVYGYQPDLVLLGPLTNLVGRDLKDDEPVRRLKSAVNTARSICGSAFVMEHHAPHKNPTEKRRSIRPYGSSMFLKWPDYGFGMAPTDTEGVYEWSRTRWPRVRKRAWPEALRWGRGSEFPWIECVLP